MFAAAGTVAAGQEVCKTCPMQAEFSAVGSEFSGTGWNMVPCNTHLERAQNWEQFTSGTYAPPVVGESGLFWW